MNKRLRIGVVGDIIPADSPLMSGQGVYSSCGGDYTRLFSSFMAYSAKLDFVVGNFEAVLVEEIRQLSPGTSAVRATLCYM